MARKKKSQQRQQTHTTFANVYAQATSGEAAATMKATATATLSIREKTGLALQDRGQVKEIKGLLKKNKCNVGSRELQGFVEGREQGAINEYIESTLKEFFDKKPEAAPALG